MRKCEKDNYPDTVDNPPPKKISHCVHLLRTKTCLSRVIFFFFSRDFLSARRNQLKP